MEIHPFDMVGTGTPGGYPVHIDPTMPYTMKTILFAVALAGMTMTASAQWSQTSGPEEGRVQTVAVSGGTTLATTATGGLHRLEGGKWEDLGSLRVTKMLASGGAFLASTNDAIIRSADRGESWDTIAAATMSQSLLEADGSVLYMVVDDTIRRSTDAGLTWMPLTGQGPAAPVWGLAAHDSTIVIGTGYGFALMRSADAGATWELLEEAELPHTMLSMVYATPDAFYAIYAQGGIYRSTDDGKSWSAINEGLPEVSGINLTNFAAVGDDLWTSSVTAVYHFEGGVWQRQQSDFATSFTVVGGDLYRHSASGLARSSNGGESWTPLNDGLRANNVDAFGELGAAIFANASSGIFRTTDGGDHWTNVARIDVTGFATSGSTIFARTQSYSDIGICRSADGGESWVPCVNGITESISQISALTANEKAVFAGFYGAFSFHENGGWRNGGIFRSTDGGDHWQAVNSGLPNNGQVNVPVIDLMAYGDTILATTARGIYRSTNNGGHWMPVALPQLEGRQGEHFVREGSTIYVTANDRVYRSTNAGASWSLLQMGLPETNYINSISIVAGKVLLVLNSHAGMNQIYTLDGSTWVDVSDQFPANITGFKAAGSRMLAGTRGSSVWSAPVGSVSGVEAERASVASAIGYPNPFSTELTVDIVMGRRGHATLDVVNAAGTVVATSLDATLDAGPHTVRIAGGGLPAGSYFYRLVVDGATVASGGIVRTN